MEKVRTRGGDLFKEERQARIVRILEEEQRVGVAVLSDRLLVSEETIRRDLKDLGGRGLIQKTHGGAIRFVSPPMPYESRLQHASQFKVAIGRAAAELVKEEESILIDSGTTALALASALRVTKARVVTNSLEVAKVIAERPEYDLTLVGGRWDPLHQFVGSAAVEQLSRYRVDKAFLGIAGLDRELGLTGPSDEEAVVKRTMLKISQQVIALVDHTKFGRVMFAHVAPATAIDVLVTDELADIAAFDDFAWKVVRVRLRGDDPA
jgi:DeoR/GlpR family transcriptional regulator of sugar metabolism